MRVAAFLRWFGCIVLGAVVQAASGGVQAGATGALLRVVGVLLVARGVVGFALWLVLWVVEGRLVAWQRRAEEAGRVARGVAEVGS